VTFVILGHPHEKMLRDTIHKLLYPRTCLFLANQFLESLMSASDGATVMQGGMGKWEPVGNLLARSTAFQKSGRGNYLVFP
jgi:hypothetical protein